MFYTINLFKTLSERIKILQRDFYIDLFNTGGSAIDEARELQIQLIEPLKEGGFNLRKWDILTQLLNFKDTLNVSWPNINFKNIWILVRF